MKKLLTLLFFTTLLFGESYKEFAAATGYETDYNVALAKAKEEKKDLMFLLITNYCPWCKKFEQRTLSNRDINAEVHKKFVPLIMNREEKNFPIKFDSPGIPVVYFVNYQDENISKISKGFQIKEDFSAEIQ